MTNEEWNSVEKNPKRNGQYLVTTESYDTHDRRIDIDTYSRKYGWRVHELPIESVVAWRPLPEPFTESEESR